MRLRPSIGLDLAVALCPALEATTAAPTLAAQNEISECATTATNAVIVTPNCTDSIPHHLVSGYFVNTTTRFNVYLPPKESWQGRFYQHMYPSQTQNATDDYLGFGAEAGGYTVQVSGQIGYRHEAAAAKYSRQIAAEYYGVDAESINGYAYGGSGGSYQTIGALENTQDVWQGFVPYIMAFPKSIPDEVSEIAFGALFLQDATGSISDAVLPGGSGQPYAGLSELQASVLGETSFNGIPIGAWDVLNYTMASQLLRGFWPVIQGIDPTFGDDFWNKPSYLGTENSERGDFLRAHRFVGSVNIGQISTNSSTDNVSSVSIPSLNVDGLVNRTILAGDTAVFSIVDRDNTTVANVTGTLDHDAKVFTLTTGVSSESLSSGLKLHYDNSFYLAAHAYARSQVPAQSEGYYTFDQYRSENGSALYPQRALEMGPLFAQSPSGGATYTGQISVKTIMVQNLLDVDAFPWNADWYRQRVRQALNADPETQTRIWYQQNADHFDIADLSLSNRTRVIFYDPYLWQALKDVANWHEQGIEPPRSSQYTNDNAQISVPYDVNQRGGIQPAVKLDVDGEQRVAVSAGEAVTFQGEAKAVPYTGKIVQIAWDYEETGNYTIVPLASAEECLSFTGWHTYSKSGEYYAAIRVATNRDGNLNENYLLHYNLARVRVVVT
ncbi:hypothetical protein V866_007947 [Kwoniella sp. B9012]